MKIVRTEITIDAPPQTVWSILDDLRRYPEWNRVLARIAGRTTVGRALDGEISFSDGSSFQFAPVISCIVGARELRWYSEVPGEPVTRAEHFFILTPTANGGTHLLHCESFDGPMADMIWPLMERAGRPDYEAMNVALKQRAEAAIAATVSLHPAVDGGARDAASGPLGVLRCGCAVDPVEVRVDAVPAHNHLCGCTQCWRPAGALFAMIAVVPAGATTVLSNGDKLAVVDAGKPIHRHACRECGVHMIGRVGDADHHFFGLEFVHPERAAGAAPRPEFAGFVSSVIDSGASPTAMVAVRKRLHELGIPACDAFSPELMDLIAWHRVKLRDAAVPPV